MISAIRLGLTDNEQNATVLNNSRRQPLLLLLLLATRVVVVLATTRVPALLEYSSSTPEYVVPCLLLVQ